MYRNVENDPRITQWHKIAALRLAHEVHNHKFSMFQNGPAFMQIRGLYDEVDKLKKQALGIDNDNETTFRRSLSFRDSNSSLDSHLNKDDLGKP